MNIQFLNNVWVRFSLLNFFLYTVVFLTRIIRDSLLFSTENGAWLFAAVLSINAILMTIVGNWFDRALENPDRLSKIAQNSYFISSLFFLFWGGWGLLDLSSTFDKNVSAIITAVFYLFSEIPIFLAINLIWVMTSEYFTDQEGQKYFPRISGFGLLGISFASFLLLQRNIIPNSGSSNTPYIFLILLGLIFLIVLFVNRWVQSSPKLIMNVDQLDFDLDDNFNVEVKSFWQQAKENYKWIKGIPFLKIFALITICNFILLAIFDNNLANGAVHLDMKSGTLLDIISKWVFSFGLFAAIFQLFFFSSILEKIGLGNMNMFAPRAMFIGVLACIILASPFFMSDNIKAYLKAFNIEQEANLLNILIFARMCGWVAEFLFNQSMLPLLYNSLPSSQVNRGRFFIEGPLTAVTNGFIGVFLLFYFWIFKEQNSLSGTNLAVLYIISLIAVIFMYIWSKQMIPEFDKVLDQRITEGSIQIDNIFENDSEPPSKVINVSLGTDAQKDKNLIKLLVLQGEKSEELISKLLLSEKRYGVKKELISALITISAHKTFSLYLDILNNSIVPDNDEPLDILVETAHHFGQSSFLGLIFKKWLSHKKSSDFSLTPDLLYHLSNSGIDNAIFVKEFLESYLNSDTKTLTERAQLETLIKIRSGEYYPQLIKLLRKRKELVYDVNWNDIARTNFASHAQVLSAFSFMLQNIKSSSSFSIKGAKILIQQYPWLIWLVFILLEHGKKHSYKLENQCLCFLPKLISINEKIISLSSASILFNAEGELDKKSSFELLSLFETNINVEDDSSLRKTFRTLFNSIKISCQTSYFDSVVYCYNYLSIKEFFNIQPEVSLGIAEILYSSIQQKNKLQIHIDELQIHVVLDLYKKHIGLLHKYKKQNCIEAENWLFKRTKQYLTLLITLLACSNNTIKLKDSPNSLASKLFNTNPSIRDNVLSRLQLSFSSKDYLDIKKTIDIYFLDNNSGYFNKAHKKEQGVNCNQWKQDVQIQLNDHLLYYSSQ